MTTINIDFSKINNKDDFYQQFQTQINLDYFGNNLDALYDVLTGDLTLPISINLNNIKEDWVNFDDKVYLQKILTTLNDIQNEYQEINITIN